MLDMQKYRVSNLKGFKSEDTGNAQLTEGCNHRHWEKSK